MIFTKALALKVLGGSLFLGSAATGIYFTNDYIQNQLTIYDQALIDHLGAGGDIKFAVLSGGSALAESNFPSFSDNSEKTITVKVRVDGAEVGSEGVVTEKSAAKGNELGSKSYLKNFNKTGNNKTGTDWTWTCEIKLTKKANIADANNLNDKQKEKIFKDSDGFLNKLKEQTPSPDANNEIKKLKQDFIRNCASARGTYINRGINGLENLGADKVDLKVSSNGISSEKKFELRKGNASNDAWGGGKEENEKLYFPNKWEFENWFQVKAPQ